MNTAILPHTLFENNGAKISYKKAPSSQTPNLDISTTFEQKLNNLKQISSADKDIVSFQPGDLESQKSPENDLKKKLNKLLPFVDKYANYSAIFANVVNFFLQTLDLSEKTRTKITNVVNVITNLSFIPYGADGMWKGIKKSNPFQAFGFFMEMFSVWFSNLKTKYLIRGLATGTDQIWVSTDYKLADKYKNGNMLNWKNGFIDVPKASWQLIKEIFHDPIGTLITTKSKGHHAILSTVGDIVATLGFALTGNEAFFGPLRDIAGVLFDFELLLRDKLIQKFSGVFFILESSFDFLARIMGDNSMRIAVNSLSHASGRLALSLYKASDPN
jgi:hypothetical protein